MMQQLDKWNKELGRLSKKRYKQMDNELYNAYKDGLKQLKLEIKQYIDAYDSLSFSQRLQVERQLQVATQINDVVNEMGGKEEWLLRSFISDEGTQGYFGTFYALEGAENIQINFAMLPEDYIEELVNTPVAGKRLSTRLYTNQSKLAQETTTALLQGAFRGEGYAKVAKRVSELTEANYKQALRIARTEGGRVQSTAKQKSYVEAKNKGIDVQKRWLSTLDKKTRHSHQQLDGQTVDVEEEFTAPSGAKAMGPRLFQEASETINCRCTTITVVNGISPDFRKDNETKEIVQYNNYKEWLEAKNKT
ncbi:phage minor head protein [Carnobacterium sp. 1290_CSPC]|uniref:phage head morphogenesis protein n=1 Tax=Carnobacterium sp. 1290_CSPC TaxID=1579347 RepID=UPI00178C9279|nr:phage minor head protein [Carnobacterium sp. 1290_CSPC]